MSKTIKADKAATRPRKSSEPKTPEAAARKREHQFGQPNANRSGNQSAAVAQREFYRWVESQATEQELREYVADTKNPYMRRKFIMAYQEAHDVQDFIAVTNQVHGAPKQVVELQDMPTIECKVFGEDKHEK